MGFKCRFKMFQNNLCPVNVWKCFPVIIFTGYQVRLDMIVQGDKAIGRSAAAFSTISAVLRRIEDLDGKLPEMVLTEFWDGLNKIVQTNRETIEVLDKNYPYKFMGN